MLRIFEDNKEAMMVEEISKKGSKISGDGEQTSKIIVNFLLSFYVEWKLLEDFKQKYGILWPKFYFVFFSSHLLFKNRKRVDGWLSWI